MTTPRHLTLAVLTACMLMSLTAEAATPKGKSPTTQAAGAGAVIDLNTATAKQLTKLPSVGKSRAAAIVDLRKRLGGFDRVEQLMRVRGIGRKTFRQMRPMVTVGHGKKAKKGKRARR